MKIDLTNSQRMALVDMIAEHMARPGATEVYVDIVEQVETTPASLLAMLLDPPAPASDGFNVFAWVGGDEHANGGGIRMFTPRGRAPLNAVFARPENALHPEVLEQMQLIANAVDAPLRLIRAIEAEQLLVVTPNPQG